ncbi:helix-turn-helix domain-containing protein [Pseudonocardia sp. C8]|uniref:helix-turn-helix domain-containing protein n=1 Tax=Pseudonocardia sp. C8 TaxID=2762759 RepID=UPI001642C432|nr:helix-turn-helix domain-containing protein [Pseudonocardia sp. C8]MBC3190321.1 helix-turn-helix domain-containing protein [Pseudonocardia sp. C8]
MPSTHPWEMFHLADGSPQEGVDKVRPEILESWRRSRFSGVDPHELSISREQIDTDSAFVRVGAPVLLNMADLLVGTSTSLALTDPTGVVTWRWESEPTIARQLDRTEVEIGSSLDELAAGTNGIGIAVAERRAVTVIGAEHYKEPWHQWACAATPVVHPVTRRICGAVNVACRAEDANHLLLVVLRSLGDGIRSALRDTATTREHRLVDAHTRFRHAAHAPVIALDRHTLIVNDAAAALELDRPALWDAVLAAGPSGASVSVTSEYIGTVYPVTDHTLADGAVLVLHRRPASVSGNTPAAPQLDLENRLTPLERAERQVIADVLVANGNNKKAAAAELGISRATLYQRLRRYGLG